MSEYVQIAICPVCLQGGVRPLMTRAAVVVAFCDECGATWWILDDLDPEKVVFPAPPEWQVVGVVDVIPGTTRWATRAETQADWAVVAAQFDQGRAFGSRDDRESP